jgi:RES domain-containing protein
MPRVYRLTLEKHAQKRSDLVAGEGARIHGGRWNHKGTPLVYAASSVSLALVEALVHSDVLPKNMVLVAYDVPDTPVVRTWLATSLPDDWADYPCPVSTQDLGTAWAADAAELAVMVPSAVVPLEMNWLLNPRHPAMTAVHAAVLGPLSFDPRLRP